MLSGFTWTRTTAANCCGETASTITPSSGVWEGLKRGEEVKEGRGRNVYSVYLFNSVVLFYVSFHFVFCFPG